MVPLELNPGNEQHPDEVDQRDADGDWEGPLPWFDNKGTLVVNGFELTEESSLSSLREAAEFLGFGRGGGKAALWTRLNQEAANRLFQEQNRHKGLVAVRAPRQPSQRRERTSRSHSSALSRLV